MRALYCGPHKVEGMVNVDQERRTCNRSEPPCSNPLTSQHPHLFHTCPGRHEQAMQISLYKPLLLLSACMPEGCLLLL